MGNHRKTWSQQEKLEIVQHAADSGVSRTSREYSVSSTSIYKWTRLYEEHGIEGLSAVRLKAGSHNQEVRKLNKKIDQLKRALADKVLEVQIKDELLKKTLSRNKKGS